MTSRSESARNMIRGVAGNAKGNALRGNTSKSIATQNIAASIDVTSSNAITFGYVNELARPGRIIGGRHRLQAPLEAGPARSAAPARNATPAGGAGFYGSCLWRADSLWCGHPVLIELLDPAIAEDESLAELFATEARAASNVASPFISRVLDFGVEASTPYLVTELPDTSTAGSGLGETLASRIGSRRLLGFTDFTWLFHDLSRGVAAIHASNLLHRDLRSDRVALLQSAGERETPKLSFGISKLMNDTLELVRTMARRAVAPAATPQYASPEQVLGTAPLGPACDVWSLAVIAFECVTGELPFVGATTGERLVQICAGPARVPSELASVPRGFDAWFARGVEKAPDARWPSVCEMADALLTLSPPRRS